MLLIILSLFLSLPCYSAKDQSPLVLRSVSERYKKLGNWWASFQQESQSLALPGSSPINEGEFYFFSPNRFIFKTFKVPRNEFYFDGRNGKVIQYPSDPSKKASIKHLKGKAAVAELEKYLLIFRGIQKKEQLSKSFKLKGKIASDKSMSLVITPKGYGEVKKLSLFFSNTELAPKKAIIHDNLGGQSIISIKKWKKIKAGLAAKLFASK